LDDDGRLPEGGDQAVPGQETPALRGRAILGLRQQTSGVGDAREEISIGARIRRIEARRKHDNGLASPSERALVRRPIDSDRATRDDYDALKRGMAREVIREVERFLVGTTRPDDRDSPIEARKRTHDPEQTRSIGQVAEARWIVRA
jgi:hypothetical protein